MTARTPGLALGLCLAAWVNGAALALPPDRRAQTDAIVRQVEQAWLRHEWQDFRSRFVSTDGRLADNGNGGISHSEGQGYAMLLASMFGTQAEFDQIWTWTQTHLLIRPDGLAAWKWDPKTARVADTNNATDGDLLIAWALLRAARTFAMPRYRDDARVLAAAIAKNLIVKTAAGPLLLPGAFGFGAKDQPDGPVLNLSYYIFPAIEAIKTVNADVDWDAVSATGLRLVEDSRFGPLRLPGDWISAAGPEPKPAKNFANTFGYDAIRIPLYLAWAGRPEAGKPRFAGLWNAKQNLGPFVTDLGSGAAVRPIQGAGFKLVAALAACVGKGSAVPEAIVSRRDDFYYPATLRLLCLAVIQERYARCL